MKKQVKNDETEKYSRKLRKLVQAINCCHGELDCISWEEPCPLLFTCLDRWEKKVLRYLEGGEKRIVKEMIDAFRTSLIEKYRRCRNG